MIPALLAFFLLFSGIPDTLSLILMNAMNPIDTSKLKVSKIEKYPLAPTLSPLSSI